MTNPRLIDTGPPVGILAEPDGRKLAATNTTERPSPVKAAPRNRK